MFRIFGVNFLKTINFGMARLFLKATNLDDVIIFVYEKRYMHRSNYPLLVEMHNLAMSSLSLKF